MRTFERLLRRTALPFHRSQGFHPKPRLIFALSLPLGVVGREEVVELELDESLSPEDIHARLACQTPPGLEILSVRRISSEGQRSGVPARLRAAGAGGSPAGSEPPYRRRASRPRVLDRSLSAPFAPGRTPTRCASFPCGPDDTPALRLLGFRELEMLLCLTSSGTARPEEVLGLLGLEDLLEAGAVLERSRLELHDELANGFGGEPVSSDPDSPPKPRNNPKGSHEKRDAD